MVMSLNRGIKKAITPAPLVSAGAGVGAGETDYMQLYQKALTSLQTGGKKLEASLQEIEEGKRQAIAGGQAGLIRGGLGGTTVMGAVPLAAEKTAARKRLGARGEAEQTYLTTLASFAAFAQRGEEAEKQRQFMAEQTLAETRSREFMELTGRQYASTEAGEQREWQTEQARLGREFGAGGGYAQQFPSLYDQGTATPDWMGAGDGIADTPWPTMAPLGGAFYGTQEAFETSLGEQQPPTQQQVGMTGAMGSLPGMKEPTISEYLQQHGLDPTLTGKALTPGVIAKSKQLQQQWANLYR